MSATDTSTPPPTPAKKQAGTEYTILHALERDSTTDTDKWEVYDTVTAKSAEEAIRASTSESGTYIAVPARSWQPRKLVVQVVNQVRLEDA